MTTPSLVSVSDIRINETMATATLDAEQVDTTQVNIVADSYLRRGRGQLTMTMPYVAGNRQKEADRKKRAGQFAEAFRQYGVTGLTVDYVEVDTPEQARYAVISYPALEALPPEGCGRLPGYQGAETLKDIDNYRIGCEMKAAMSAQISNPSDLMGTAGTPNGYSSREGVVVNGYMTGTPNEPIEGYSASAVGGMGGGGGE